METNFWRVVRMTAAVLLGMRAHGSGHIVNVTSLAGLVSKPFWAFSNSSKFSVEGNTEMLRHEVRRFGIRVSVAEPGSIKRRLLAFQ